MQRGSSKEKEMTSIFEFVIDRNPEVRAEKRAKIDGDFEKSEVAVGKFIKVEVESEEEGEIRSPKKGSNPLFDVFEPKQQLSSESTEKRTFPKPVRRYFDCQSCGQRGHSSSNCPQKKEKLCGNCGGTGHSKFKCPKRVCLRCFKMGHTSKECGKAPNLICYNCGERGHESQMCPNETSPVRKNNGQSINLGQFIPFVSARKRTEKETFYKRSGRTKHQRSSKCVSDKKSRTTVHVTKNLNKTERKDSFDIRKEKRTARKNGDRNVKNVHSAKVYKILPHFSSSHRHRVDLEEQQRRICREIKMEMIDPAERLISEEIKNDLRKRRKSNSRSSDKMDKSVLAQSDQLLAETKGWFRMIDNPSHLDGSKPKSEPKGSPWLDGNAPKPEPNIRAMSGTGTKPEPQVNHWLDGRGPKVQVHHLLNDLDPKPFPPYYIAPTPFGPNAHAPPRAVLSTMRPPKAPLLHQPIMRFYSSDQNQTNRAHIGKNNRSGFGRKRNPYGYWRFRDGGFV